MTTSNKPAQGDVGAPTGLAERALRGHLDGQIARRVVLVAAIALGLFTLLFVIWHSSSALFTILGGVVLAALLDALAHAGKRILPVGRTVRLIVVLVLLLALLFGMLALGGGLIAGQIAEFTSGSQGVFQALGARLEGSFLGNMLPEGYSVRDLLSGFVGGSEGAGENIMWGAGVVFSGLSTAALIVFLGCFFAVDPTSYRAGILSVLPKDQRPRVGEVLVEMGGTLRQWLFGQLISMTIVGLLTTVLLLLVGMPFALLLGLQAGLLAFIPTLGPLIAAVPILIAGATEGFGMVLWGIGVYVLVQGVESNLVMPLVQKRVVELAPAFTLGSQLVLGALFGFAGLALAVPLMAMAKVAIEALYVEDDLGGAATGHEGERAAAEGPHGRHDDP